MAQNSSFYFLSFFMFLFVTTAFSPSLSTNYYDNACPKALPTIKRIVQDAVNQERRMGSSLLRLHFHDCFVNGCDASILLDQTSSIDSEKSALPNVNSVRGYEAIDRIKTAVDKVCGRPVVSCADILTVAARDSVVALGGPSWTVPLGRRDSKTTSRDTANRDLPSPFLDLPGLIDSFQKQGLNAKDLVALSGAHTLRFSKCGLFKNRIYNETNNIDPVFARLRQNTCPHNGGDANIAPLDQTAVQFDTKYFSNLVRKRGLLHSDQALFNGGQTDGLARSYRVNAGAFANDFAVSMVKIGNIKPLTGRNGEVRLNCRRVNNSITVN